VPTQLAVAKVLLNVPPPVTEDLLPAAQAATASPYTATKKPGVSRLAFCCPFGHYYRVRPVPIDKADDLFQFYNRSGGPYSVGRQFE